MKPSRVSARLRRIAANIDSCNVSVRPDLVRRDLHRVLAAMEGGLSVLNQPTEVDVPGHGIVTVTVHQVGSLGENNWKNVSGTVTVPAGDLSVTTSGGKGLLDDNAYDGPEAQAFFTELQAQAEWRPVDVFSIAISKVIEASGAEVPEFPEVQDGMFVPSEGEFEEPEPEPEPEPEKSEESEEEDDEA